MLLHAKFKILYRCSIKFWTFYYCYSDIGLFSNISHICSFYNSNFAIVKVYLVLAKDIRIIILYAVPISLWPTLGKENQYFYTRHPFFYVAPHINRYCSSNHHNSVGLPCLLKVITYFFVYCMWVLNVCILDKIYLVFFRTFFISRDLEIYFDFYLRKLSQFWGQSSS